MTSRPLSRSRIALAGFCVGWALQPCVANAQAAREERSREYWVTHASVTAGALLVAGGASFMEAEPMVDRFAVRMDPGVIYQYSPLAAHVSDGLVVVEMVAPVIFLGVEASRAQFSNASLIHAEALSINLALNGLMKYAVRRPRPYTYNPERAIRERYDCSRTTDACLSFYSGHSSTAFAAAFSGVLLTNETVAMSAGYRALWWGVMLGGASATAQLRVRAGKHFYSDVVVGALVGSAIGIMVPRIHGSRYTPELAEVGAGSAGLVVGALLPLLVPSDELPNELSLSVGISGAPGLALSGRW